MPDRVKLHGAAFLYLNDLISRGIYPNIDKAIIGELARAKVQREQERVSQEEEVLRRMALRPDGYDPLPKPADRAAGARRLLAE